MTRILTLTILIISISFQGALSAMDHSSYINVMECITCHPRALPTHKQRAPDNMSEDWPLTSDRKMVCITCHNCISGKCVLRKQPNRLCMVCHDCTQGMSCMIGTAHIGNSETNIQITSLCVSCHDGTAAKEADGPGNHQTEVLYLIKKKFREISDKRVVFIDGKVTCLSCHNPYTLSASKLVKSNMGSRLCLTCHIK
jgi:predicted CXXCH cytochrome family protein